MRTAGTATDSLDQLRIILGISGLFYKQLDPAVCDWYSEMVDSVRFLVLYESCEDKEHCCCSQHWTHYQVVSSVVFLLVHLQIELLAHTHHLLLPLLSLRLVIGRPAGSEMKSSSKGRNCCPELFANLRIEQTYVPSCSLFTWGRIEWGNDCDWCAALTCFIISLRGPWPDGSWLG